MKSSTKPTQETLKMQVATHLGELLWLVTEAENLGSFWSSFWFILFIHLSFCILFCLEACI
ncbi:uncharacterized protein DS421_20g698660 [Arachis hypogaea]|nr:uncharacterized protein DS421_20g698660 [Arachis hypogaea]